MAGNSVTPDRVKRLLSSFLGNGASADTTSGIHEKGDGEKKDIAGKKSETGIRSKDKPAYFDRVESYSSLTWCAKPSELTPMVCARYGWKNTDLDLLQCVDCKSFLSGELPVSVESPVYRESCDKLMKGLSSAHEALCPWSNNPSPESFMNIPYYNRGEVLTEFSERLKILTVAGQQLPDVNRKTLHSQGLKEDQLQNLYNKIKTSQTDNPSRPEISLVASLLALCGWTYSNQSKVEVVWCSYCRRKVGLWNYTSTSDTQTDQSDAEKAEESRRNEDEEGDEGPSCKRLKTNKPNFDPVAEHKYWCPWIQTVTPIGEKPESMNGKHYGTSHIPVLSPAESPPTTSEISRGGKPTWLAVADVLYSERTGQGCDTIYSRMKTSPQLEGVRRLRRVLNDCTSPSPTKRALDAS